MPKQTVIKWLEDNYLAIKKNKNSWFQQAKEIEKEQMFEFWNGGIKCTEEGGKSFEQYYDETYGGDNGHI